MSHVIQTERLLSRPFRDADGAVVVAFLKDFEISDWLTFVPHPFKQSDLMLTNTDGSSRWPGLVAIETVSRLVGAVSTGGYLGYWPGLGFRENSGQMVLCRARGQKPEHTNMDLTRDCREGGQCP